MVFDMALDLLTVNALHRFLKDMDFIYSTVLIDTTTLEIQD